MSFLLLPDYKFKAITDISPSFLKGIGVKLLLMDLDNTITPYSRDVPTSDVKKWIDEMKENGIRLFIVSNNKGSRPETFSEVMKIPYLKFAKKPSRKGLIRAMQIENMEKNETALVGDQIYTDVLAANRAGVTSLLVEPISLKNPLHAARYVLEIPFRVSRKRRNMEVEK